MSKTLNSSTLAAQAMQNAQAQIGNTQQLGGVGGNIYINNGAAGNITINPTSGAALNGNYIMNPGGYTVTYNWLPLPLTKEEEDELTLLEEQFRIENKTAKIEEFKKVEPSLRQQIINYFLWEESVNTINAISTTKSSRLIELQARKNGIFSQNGSTVSWYNYATYNLVPRLPSDMSIEDLKVAHIEASMEEQVINETIT